MNSDEPEFLDVEDVIELHATQLEVYGGAAGLRDRGSLLTMGVAEGRIEKAAVAVELARIAKTRT